MPEIVRNNVWDTSPQGAKSACLSRDRVVSDGGAHVVVEASFLGEVLPAHRDGADQHAPVNPAIPCRLQ